MIENSSKQEEDTKSAIIEVLPPPAADPIGKRKPKKFREITFHTKKNKFCKKVKKIS